MVPLYGIEFYKTTYFLTYLCIHKCMEENLVKYGLCDIIIAQTILNIILQTKPLGLPS